MLEEIDSDELTEWIMFENMYPFVERRIDINAGIVASANVNALSTFLGGKNSKKDYSPLNFIPEYGKKSKQKEEMTVDQMYQMALMINGLFGGTVEWDE